MAKKENSAFHLKKFRPENGKTYVRKTRLYPTFLYNQLDKWLKSMSRNGWHIVHCSTFFFWFEKGETKTKEYFTYGLSTQEGKYNLLLRHPSLEKLYGLRKDKSKINRNKAKSYQIVEIDQEKIDVENDVGYRELIDDRNRLYTRYLIRNISILSTIVSFLIALLVFF